LNRIIRIEVNNANKKTTSISKKGTGSAGLRLAETKRSIAKPMPETNKEHLAAEGLTVWQKETHFAGDKLAYSVKEAAEALGVSNWYIRDEMAQGKLAFSCPRGRQMIPRWELIRYLEASINTTGHPSTEHEGFAAARVAELQRVGKRKQVMA